jgi:hypothetical protein
MYLSVAFRLLDGNKLPGSEGKCLHPFNRELKMFGLLGQPVGPHKARAK